jgi:hypothetical protein
MRPDIENVAVRIAYGPHHNPINVIKDVLVYLSGQILAHTTKIGQEFGLFLIMRVPPLDELNGNYACGVNKFLWNQTIKTRNDLFPALPELPASLMTLL